MALRYFLAAILYLLFSLDALSQRTTPVSLNVGYRQVFCKGPLINSGNGLYFEPVLHLNKIFSLSTKLSVFAGWGWQDRMRPTAFHTAFASDYSSEVFSEKNSGLVDSTLIRTSARLISSKKGKSGIAPGCNTNSFHDYELYVGIGYELPAPLSPVIRLYRGALRSHYQGAALNHDFEIFQIQRNYWGFDLSISRAFMSGAERKGVRLGAGVFAQLSNLKTAKLYFDNGDESRSIMIRNFVSKNFVEKYAHELRTGLRIFIVFE